jgi:hypothetical protein
MWIFTHYHVSSLWYDISEQSLDNSGFGTTDNFPGWVFDTAENDADGFSASGLFGH